MNEDAHMNVYWYRYLSILIISIYIDIDTIDIYWYCHDMLIAYKQSTPAYIHWLNITWLSIDIYRYWEIPFSHEIFTVYKSFILAYIVTKICLHLKQMYVCQCVYRYTKKEVLWIAIYDRQSYTSNLLSLSSIFFEICTKYPNEVQVRSYKDNAYIYMRNIYLYIVYISSPQAPLHPSYPLSRFSEWVSKGRQISRSWYQYRNRNWGQNQKRKTKKWAAKIMSNCKFL